MLDTSFHSFRWSKGLLCVSKSLSLSLKATTTAVWSVLTYGCETWVLADSTIKTIWHLNGINSHIVSYITGQSIARVSFHLSNLLVKNIHHRLLRWLGDLFREREHTKNCISGHIHIKFWVWRGEVLETVSEGYAYCKPTNRRGGILYPIPNTGSWHVWF